MRKSILVMLITVLSTNVFFLIDETSIFNEDSIQISEEEKSEQILPTGAWFTEDDEFL